MKKFLLLLTFIMSQGLIAAPIHDAVKRGDIDEVKRILSPYFSSKGLNDIDDFGLTPLHCASIWNRENMVEMLIKHGANVNVVGEEIGLSLHIAAAVGREKIVEMLIRHGADVNAINSKGETSLHCAAYNGHVEIVEMLIKHGANVNAVNNDEETPLHNAVNTYVGTLLYEDSFRGHAETVEMLIIHGANINAVDNDGWTSLHRASFRGHENIVRILLEDIWRDHTITNHDGNTSEDVARLRGNQEIVDMLRNAPSVTQKVLNSGKGLQLLAARVANKEGVYEEDYNELGTSVKHWITNIRKGKQQQKRCSIL